MTRDRIRASMMHVANDEDRRTYRRWMRTFVLVYGTLIVVAIGSAMLRAQHRVDEAGIKNIEGTIPVAARGKGFDR